MPRDAGERCNFNEIETVGVVPLDSGVAEKGKRKRDPKIPFPNYG